MFNDMKKCGADGEGIFARESGGKGQFRMIRDLLFDLRELLRWV